MIRLASAGLLLTCLAIALAPQSTQAQGEGPKPLFNGKDLKGWVNVNCAPGTFFVKDGEIITTGSPTGFLRTDRQYENFELDFDWMHVEKERMANSGLFVWGDPIPAVGTPYTRGIEVQVLINFAPKDGWATSHGDIFSIWGARCTPDRPHFKGIERCLPSENRVKGGGEWNHYKVIANDGVVKLHVNGKEVSGVSKCNPRKGYLALESEGAECHFKNITIKELPSTNPKPDEVADIDRGYMSLFDGLTLKGWRAYPDDKNAKTAWKVGGGHLNAAGKDELVTDNSFGKMELVFDWKLPAKSDGKMHFSTGVHGMLIQPNGKVGLTGCTKALDLLSKDVETKAIKSGAWNRTIFTCDGKTVSATINGEVVATLKADAPADGLISFVPSEGLQIMNVFLREIK